MVIRNNFYNQVNKVTGTYTTPARRAPSNIQEDFAKILQEKIDQGTGIKFSKHAELRMQARNINLSQTHKNRIDEGVKKAEAKGVKDSLVLMDDIAFVVNIKSKTVITAVNSSELKENVFTNIDGAVIV